MTNICSLSSFGMQEHIGKENDNELVCCHLLEHRNTKNMKIMTNEVRHHFLQLSNRKKKKTMTNICLLSFSRAQEHEEQEDDNELGCRCFLQLSNKKKKTTMTIRSLLSFSKIF